MMWSDGNWGWGAWLAMSAMMVAFAAILIWAVLVAARRHDRDSESILADRFARGEIDADEYHRCREALRSSR